MLLFFLAEHMETSIDAHLENASSQTEESKIAAHFQTVYAKLFLAHKLYPNLNEKSSTLNVWSNSFRNGYLGV